jgi:single-strand DNA-binding protein
MLSNTTIVGHLTADPEVRSTPNGKRVATLRVAVNDFRLGDEPRFIDVDQWEDAADRAAKHLVKGQQIAAEGLLDARAFVPKDGGDPRIGWGLIRARVEWGHRPKGNPNFDANGEPTDHAAPREGEPAF